LYTVSYTDFSVTKRSSMFRTLWRHRKTSRRRREECPTGIKVLCDPKDPSVDIIFVHGLNGHRENTWRYEGAPVSWPEAFLSQDICNARIMTYGYEATVVNWDEFLGKVSSNRIKQHAHTCWRRLLLIGSITSHVKYIAILWTL